MRPWPWEEKSVVLEMPLEMPTIEMPRLAAKVSKPVVEEVY